MTLDEISWLQDEVFPALERSIASVERDNSRSLDSINQHNVLEVIDDYPETRARWQRMAPRYYAAQAAHAQHMASQYALQPQAPQAAQPQASQAVQYQESEATQPAVLPTARTKGKGKSNPAPSLLSTDLPLSCTWSARTAGTNNYLKVNARPGGKLEHSHRNVKHEVRSRTRYGTKKDGTARSFEFIVSHLNLCGDENPRICYGVFGNGPLCPYISTPDECAYYHSLEQGVLDFMVTKRGVSHAYIDRIIGNYETRVPYRQRKFDCRLDCPTEPSTWGPVSVTP
ncbi:hypothetical protein N0V95_007583 [Ascochyta clinopodiicola]|nr:hypothetical protein N0V95_007583 [Ascochyta clinopodiicola]